MTILLASMLLAGAQIPSTADAQEDAIEILRIVLAVEARTHRPEEPRDPPCVRRDVGRTTLWRQPRIDHERGRQTVSAGTSIIAAVPELAESPVHNWFHVVIDSSGGVTLGEQLSGNDLEQLRAAEQRARTAMVEPTLVTEIDPAWLRPPLSMCGQSEAWPYLEFGAPRLVGDWAFVRADFRCPLCGLGVIYSLRRRSQTWEIFAAATLWVS